MIDEATQDAIREGVEAAVKEHQKGQPTNDHGVPMHGPYVVLSLKEIEVVSGMFAAALDGREVRIVAGTRRDAQDVFDRCLAALGSDPKFRVPHP